jgi:hypothetical protein
MSILDEITAIEAEIELRQAEAAGLDQLARQDGGTRVRLVLEVRDVLPPGALDEWSVPHMIRAGETWARLRIVARDAQPAKGWAWYVPGATEGPMTHQPGEQWAKVAGYGIGG